jgi:hypothetical protein
MGRSREAFSEIESRTTLAIDPEFKVSTTTEKFVWEG